jgi:hypothetical protein
MYIAILMSLALAARRAAAAVIVLNSLKKDMEGIQWPDSAYPAIREREDCSC